jgi:LmbE family N-acetylglucosaminyl deacetylase
MRRIAGVLVALAACRDARLPEGEPLGPAPDLTVVAHQDDDLLFMQPDVADLAARRAGLTNVYVTAGNGRRGIAAADRRYRGLMEAYAAAAGLESRWSCGWIVLAGHLAEHCRLRAGDVSLVFLGYPDGGKEGELGDSLLRLWDGRIGGAETIARRPTRYDREGLIAAVAEVIVQTAPTTLRTLELASTHGRDHADHQVVGALAMLAAASAGYEHALLSFRGYSTEEAPENVTGAAYDRAFDMLARYHACASRCASCGSACGSFLPAHQVWARRRYAVARRTALPPGRLRLGGRCAVIGSSGALALGDCAAAPAWRLDASGALRVGERCLGALPSGELVAGGACPADGSHWFMLDDEGHLWVGRPPEPSTVRRGAHARCVDAQARASTCGAGHAPSWELVAPE